MRQFNDDGGQYEIKGMSGANVQHGTDKPHMAMATLPMPINTEVIPSLYLITIISRWISFDCPFLSKISIMFPSTVLVLFSIALGISATAVDLHHQSPANPFTLGFFGTPEIRDSINLKVKGKVKFTISYLCEHTKEHTNVY